MTALAADGHPARRRRRRCASATSALATAFAARAVAGADPRRSAATRATPARSCAPPTPQEPTPWCSPTPPSTRTTRSACGRPPGSLFHLPFVAGVAAADAVAAAREAGLRPGDGRSRRSRRPGRPGRRAGGWPARPPGCSATRRGASRSRCRPWPTAWSPSRSTGAPRASTWRRRLRSASTLRPGATPCRRSASPRLTRRAGGEVNRGARRNERLGTYRAEVES